MPTSSAERNPLELLAEEFAERLRGGSLPSLEEYIDQYPQYAEQIRKLFPALVMLEQLKPAAGDLTGDFGGVAPEENHPLERLGDYRILREVGRGGMGVVYEAEQVSLGRHVALKVLPSVALLPSSYLERFQREAKAAARLHHTNIVPVFGVGESDGVRFSAMQFICGEGIDKVLADVRRLRRFPVDTVSAEASVAHSLLTGRFESATTAAPEESAAPPDRSASLVDPVSSSALSASGPEAEYCRGVARIGAQVADALAYAHRQGILHRDIKPSNLLLDLQGTAWVTDFGLVKVEGTDDLTQQGDIVGTLRYMAPERFEGRSLPQSDVYALGITLYEMLTLRPAFDDANKAKLIGKVLHDAPTGLRKIDPRIPRDLETVVMKCLDKDPSQRYATAGMLAEDLRRFLADRPIKARRSSRAEQVWRWCRRNPAVAALTASVLLLLVTVAVVSGVSSLWLKKALGESKEATAEANARLWGSYQDQARASRMTRQPGQRFKSLRAIENALRLPLPSGRSRDELRTEAIAALCIPDFEIAKEWDGVPEGNTTFAIDSAFERYALGDKDGNVSVRRIEGNAVLFELSGTGPVAAYGGLEFSPDGRFLHQICNVTRGTHDRLWWIDGPKRVVVLDDGHVGGAFRPDSGQFAAWYPDGSIRLHDLATGQEVRRFACDLNRPWLAWNPRHAQLAVVAGSVLRVMDLETGKVLREKQQVGGRIAWIDWHPDGNVLAVANHETPDRSIHLWDTRTGQLACPPLQGLKNDGLIVRFNHAGDRLVSNDWSGMLRLWDTRTGRHLLAHPARGTCLKFSHDDGLLAADVAFNKVRLFRWRTGREFRTLTDHYPADERALHSAIIHPAGRLLAIQSASGVLLADRVRGEEVALLRLPGGNRPLRFDPAADSLWTNGSCGMLRWPIRADPDKPQGYRVGPPERLAAIKAEGMMLGSSSDGKVVAIPNFSGGALLWKRDLDRISNLEPQHDVRSCAVSPDGRWVATGSHGNLGDGARAKVWDAHTEKHVADLSVGHYCAVGFSPDGKWLMTTGGGFRLWEVGTWREGPTLGESLHNRGFAFSADGKLLALGDATPGVVRLVVPDTGKELARLTGPEPTRLMPLCFTPDGAHLITLGDESREVHLFDLRAIREQLKELDLDWDAPPYPAEDEAQTPAALRQPLEVKVVGAELADPKKMAEYERAQPIAKLYFNPFDADAHYRMGKLLLEAGNAERAHAHLGAALAFRPDLGAAHSPRAKAGSKLGRWKEAHEDFTRHLARDPEDAEAYHERGHVNERLHRYREAVDDFSQAIARKPKSAHLLDHRGENYLLIGRHAEAVADCRKSLEINPEQARPNRNLAWIHANGPAKFRDPKKALPLAQRAVAIGAGAKEESRYHHTLGVVYYRLGRWEEAKKAFERGLEIRMGKSTAYYDFFLAMCHVKLGDMPKAGERFRQGVTWIEAQKGLPAVYVEEMKAFRAEADELLRSP